MFDNIVENVAKKLAAELAASLISVEALANLADNIREIVYAHALMPLSPEYTLGLTLVGGEIRVGQFTDVVNPDTGVNDPMGVFEYNVHRTISIEADHLDRDFMSHVAAEFEDDPEEPTRAVFGSDLLVYAILHELTGASLTTLARVYAAEQMLEMDPTANSAPFPAQVLFLAKEALLYHSEHFSFEARVDRYGGGELAE